MFKISVIMPVYNGERYLREAIESILSQTFNDFEFIIIDDGSVDGTSEIINSYHDNRIVRFRQEINKGVIYSLNRGLEIAQGEIIARQDADDISMPNRLECQVKVLDQYPNTVIVGAATYTIDENGNHIGGWSPPTSDTDIRWQMLFQCSFVHTSVVIRADILRQNELRYNPKALHAEDFELWSRLLCYGNGNNVPEPLVKYRCHPKQVSELFTGTQKSVADLIAQNNLKRINIQASHEEIRSLRAWENASKTFLYKEDMGTCKLFLKILGQFKKQPYVDRTTYERLVRRHVSKIYNAVGRHNFSNVVFSGLLFSLFKAHLPLSLEYFLNLSFRFLKKLFSAKHI